MMTQADILARSTSSSDSETGRKLGNRKPNDIELDVTQAAHQYTNKSMTNDEQVGTSAQINRPNDLPDLSAPVNRLTESSPIRPSKYFADDR
jgi:hypothetical protein